MKHPTKDQSLFSIDIIDELVEEYMQLGTSNVEFSNFVEIPNVIGYFNSVEDVSDSVNMSHIQDLFDSMDNIVDLADLVHMFEISDVTDLVCRCDRDLECSSCAKLGIVDIKRPIQVASIVEAESDSKQPILYSDRVGQPTPTSANKVSPPHSPSIKLKSLPHHLKYAYLDDYQQFLVIIANNLHREQEEKFLKVLRKHKKAIGWTLEDLPGINPSICMHKILLEEEARPIRQLNSTILDVVKKEVTKLLAIEIIYPISDSQWVSLVQVVPKKSGMIVVKNQHDKMNSWQVCIDYRKLNQATRKDHFPLPFIGQSNYCFLDGFFGYMQIHITLVDQHKTTFKCPFETFAYTRMSFGLYNTSSTFQRCMINIFLDLLKDCIEVFMDDFIVYAESFEACLENLSRVLRRCMEPNLILNFEKCHFMVTEGIVLGHLVSSRGIEVDKAKVDIITSLPNLASLREVRSFLGHAGFYRHFIKNFSKITLPLSKLLQKDVEFVFDQSCVDAFQELKK
ncbi:Retrovirus-related Pol polyprotein, partial [Mucuna pruriens]